MKQNDIILIIVCVFVSGALSFVLSNTFISAPKNRQTKVEVIEKLSPDFNKPDPKYFNVNSENPTQLIIIGGENENNTPFTN